MTTTNHQPEHHNGDHHDGEPTLPASLVTLLRDHAGADIPLRSGESGVESRVDDAVMSLARERLGAIEPPRTLRFPMFARVVGGLSVAAAAIGLVVWFGPGAGSNTAPVNAPRGTLGQDEELAFAESARSDAVDTDAMMGVPMLADAAPEPDSQFARSAVAGRTASSKATSAPNIVTIRDAYLVALAIENDAPLDDAWDANSDGAVDDADVEALAIAAVALGDRLGFAPVPWYTPTLGALWPLAHTHTDRSVTR